MSNTKFFYDRGWHGINIEPNAETIKLFLQKRKRDINLNIGIGSLFTRDRNGAIFYEFETESLSTFSRKQAKLLAKCGYKLRRKITIPMFQLKDVMRKYITSAIDFMSVDVEGLDLDVLKSNDWNKYRPKLLCIETINFIDFLSSTSNTLRSCRRKSVIDKYLTSKGYKKFFENGLNTLYKDQSTIKSRLKKKKFDSSEEPVYF